MRYVFYLDVCWNLFLVSVLFASAYAGECSETEEWNDEYRARIKLKLIYLQFNIVMFDF